MRAFTTLFGSVIHLTPSTILTTLNTDVEVLISGARSACLAIKDRLVSRTSLTVLAVGVVDEIFGTGLTCFCLVVEVFGQIAWDTLLLIPKRFFFRALATSLLNAELFPVLTARALVARGVEEERRSTGNAFGAIDLVRSLSSANASFLLGIKGRSLETVVALPFSRVPEASIRTSIAVCTVEEGVFWRAELALKRGDIEYLF